MTSRRYRVRPVLDDDDMSPSTSASSSSSQTTVDPSPYIDTPAPPDSLSETEPLPQTASKLLSEQAARLPHWRDNVPNLIEPEIDLDDDASIEEMDPTLLSEDITEIPGGIAPAPLETSPSPAQAPRQPVRPREAQPADTRTTPEAVEQRQTVSRTNTPDQTRPLEETTPHEEAELRDAEDRAKRRTNPIVPRATMAGRALTLVVAIMSFLACLTVGALTLVHDATRSWQSEVAKQVTIQVMPVDGQSMEERLDRAVLIANSWGGVTRVAPLSDAQTRALLEPWLGRGLDITELPVPRLIAVEVSDLQAFDADRYGQELAQLVDGAVLDDHQQWTDRLSTMASAAIVIGVLVLILVLTAMALSVVFATRSAMAANKDVVEVLHLVGAENSFIAGEFQRHFLVLGLKGGLVGGLGAILALLLAAFLTSTTRGAAISEQVTALSGGLSVGPESVIGALGVIFLVTIVTALTSRVTVHKVIDQVQ